jgi:hypothetical protein
MRNAFRLPVLATALAFVASLGAPGVGRAQG